MKFFSKKRVAVLAVLAVAAISAVAAYAYFTAAGHGTGTFTSGQIGTVTVNSDPAGPLYPGAAPTTVQVRVTNNGNGSQYVGAISGSIDPNSLPAGCDPSWFTINPIGAQGLVGAHQEVDPTTTISLNESGGNQNACANATFTIDWTSSTS